jgi:hypothetical protein
VTLSGEVVGVPSPPLSALPFLITSCALKVDAEQAAAFGYRGVSECVAGGIVAYPGALDNPRVDATALEKESLPLPLRSALRALLAFGLPLTASISAPR